MRGKGLLARAAAGSAAALACACAAAGAPAAGAAAGTGSLYSGRPPRPGPDLLYRGPARSPQLANRGLWHAAPILVSGATAYRRGEFLYQDFLYDDHGAAGGVRDPQDPRSASDLFSQPNGSYTYPDDRRYADNAADLVELRVKPLPGATAFRITYNTMKDPSLVAATIAIGAAKAPVAYPHGAGVEGPARYFLTVHGSSADLLRAGGARAISPAPRVSVSKRRRQVQVLVPHRAWNPGRRTVRLAIGTGLWDRDANRYLVPQQARTATEPGGAGNLADPPAFFNVGFRAEEPLPDVTDPGGTAFRPAWWRDTQQGTQLAAGTMAPFSARVDFAKLRRGATDNSGVPRRGPLDRILASRFEVGQGTDFSVSCLAAREAPCPGQYQGRLQPYLIYVPHGPVPAPGYGMTLLMHSLAANYNQYGGSRNQRQFGERGPGSIVITPEARGPDGPYASYAEADVFEVWADVARHYRLDPGWTVASGYSMGGFGTFRLSEQFPDLFARAQPTVGTELTTYREASLRNVPVLMWNGAGDELVNPALFIPAAAMLESLGYRYELDVFHPGEHLSLAINDQFAPAAQFLGTARVKRNPLHVTYVLDPATDARRLGIVADHAYWVSGLKLRDPDAGHGTIDATSHGFGRADPVPGPTRAGVGALSGGALFDPYPFDFTRRAWGKAPRAPKRDRLEIEAENIARAVIDPARARLDCRARVDLTSDGPLSVRLAGCGRTVRAG